MNYKEFTLKEEEYIQKFKSSKLYLTYLELDKEISNDKEIQNLAKQRDEYYHLAEENINRKENLIKGKQIHDKIISFDKVKKYYEYRKKIRDIISLINESILRDTIK